MFKSFYKRAFRCFLSSSAIKNVPPVVCHGGPISNITKVWFTPLPDKSKWITPCKVHYVENGQKKDRDIIKIFDGVMVILFNISRQKLIYVRQFRAAVYHGIITGNSLEIPKGDIDLIKYPPEMAVTLEPCAGLIDKSKSLPEIAREEVLEECGYDIPVKSFEFIYAFKSGVGASSSTQTFFYCEVCDAQKVSNGGGIHDEVIQVVELSIEDARQMVKTGSTIIGGPSTLLGTLWFLANKT
ncbi:uridine diphosphate glucose pyrophosphatase NUDT14-like [Drosophila innubila]|uniref:uridine diphosphate glucose pyrophosphatase NUDT14-like n=1 Tax=Drosophila innubila TaxID=198719 RepID=UPI00148BD32F|nr:uridine diphosphate glucose pyrophosphatase NUDT14-like [Drosophila innubila]